MAKSMKKPEVDAAIGRAGQWQDAFGKLRAIALECGLAEALKWGQPCYTLDDSNIVLMHGFKDYCALLFMKGALMKDPQGILVQQTKNVQAARQIRFAGANEIVTMKPVLKAYILEAIRVEKAGLTVKRKTTAESEMPEEFRHALGKNAALKKAFAALTPGRQRGYLLHFSSARQAATRQARIEKHAPRILKGLGLYD